METVGLSCFLFLPLWFKSMSNIGNHRGWYAVLCLHVTWLIFVGVIKGLGIMLPTLKQQFTAETWLIGWMIAVVSGSSFFSGIFAAPLESLFGSRAVIIAGGFLVGGSLIAASIATSVVQLTVSLALGFGPGISFTTILSKAMIGRCFTTNYATANGIGQAGSPMGLIIMAPLVQLLLDTYGWRGALLLLGGISLNLAVCGALLRQPSTEKQNQQSYQHVPSCEETKSNLRRDKETISRIQFLKEVLMTITRSFGTSVCFQKTFWIPTIIFMCVNFIYTSWNIYYVDHALGKGFSAEDAVVFCTAAGVLKLIGRLLNGPLVDRGIFKLRFIMGLILTLISLSLLTDPWMNSYLLALVNVGVYSVATGAMGPLVDVFTRELIGLDLLTCAFSWMEFVTGLLLSGGGFVPGLIHDLTGSYNLSFVTMGCLNSLSLVALITERLCVKQPL